VADQRNALAHVLWIGGGSCVGKTTLSRLLAGKYDLKIYNLDWHHVREHRQRPGPHVTQWERWSMDERWVLPSVPELLERTVAIWEEQFALVLQDLLALPTTRPIVAEGPGAFPWCVAPLLRSREQAVFLVPTAAVRDRVRAAREHGASRFDNQTSDPDRARSNLRQRDLLLNARLVAACQALGIRWIDVDEGLALDATLSLVEEHFRSHLPLTLNV